MLLWKLQHALLQEKKEVPVSLQPDHYKLCLNGKPAKEQPRATVNAKLIPLPLLSTVKLENIKWTADGNNMRETHRPLLSLGNSGADRETKLSVLPETRVSLGPASPLCKNFQLICKSPAYGCFSQLQTEGVKMEMQKQQAPQGSAVTGDRKDK